MGVFEAPFRRHPAPCRSFRSERFSFWRGCQRELVVAAGDQFGCAATAVSRENPRRGPRPPVIHCGRRHQIDEQGGNPWLVGLASMVTSNGKGNAYYVRFWTDVPGQEKRGPQERPAMPGQQSRQVDETRAAKHQPLMLRSARSLIGGLITCRKGSGNRSSPRPPHPGGLPAKNGLTPSR